MPSHYFFPDYCVVEPRLIIIICSILVDAVRGEVKRGPCGNYCRRTSTHYKTADCNGNVSHLNRAVKRLRMSCNCSEKLGMSFFVHQRIWIAATRLVSHWCSGIKLWCLKFKFKFLFQVGVLILCLSSMLKHTIYVIMGWKINRAVFSVFSKVLLIHYSLTMFSLLNQALSEPVFNKHRKKIILFKFRWNFYFSLSGNWCGHYLFYSFISVGVRRYIDEISIGLFLNIL